MEKKIDDSSLSRRSFMGNSGKIAGVGALAGVTLPMVHGNVSCEAEVAVCGNIFKLERMQRECQFVKLVFAGANEMRHGLGGLVKC